MCGGEKERSARTLPTIQARAEGGSFIVTAQEWGWQGSWRWGVQYCPMLQTDQGMNGEEAWKGERRDSRHEGGGQRKSSLLRSHQMQWESTDATSYTIKIDGGTLTETKRKCFAICTGWMNWSVLKWCLTMAATIHSGLLQLSNKWHTGKAKPIKIKSSVTPKAQQTPWKVKVTFLHV